MHRDRGREESTGREGGKEGGGVVIEGGAQRPAMSATPTTHNHRPDNVACAMRMPSLGHKTTVACAICYQVGYILPPPHEKV